MKYSQQDLMQGMTLRQQAQETPSSFGTMDGASETASGNKPPKSRMAGQVGARIQDIMNNPAEAARTQQWMQQFQMATPWPPMQ